ncbi:MAG: type IX secretion system protein PorQ [Bacteroidota bacterium]
MNLLKTLFLVCVTVSARAQTGGGNSYSFLDLPFNARSAALGNDFISSRDEDVNLAIQNPSLYNSSMDRMLGFNQALLAGGINYGMLTYARKYNEQLTGGFSLRYVTYGNMERRNEAGVSEGKFYAGDFIVSSGVSKQLNPLISVGANINLVYSQLESYSSFGVAADLAGIYELKEKNLVMTALVKNAGYQLKSYTKGNRAPLPAEFQFAIAHKVKHAPFRFTLLLHHLNKFDLTYVVPGQKPTIDALTGDTIPVQLPGIGEKIFRHLTYQVELIFSKNFHLRTAFDYHLRQEMKVAARPGISGFSFGIGMKFKRFSLDYGLVAYSAAGFNNQLTLNLNLGQFRK